METDMLNKLKSIYNYNEQMPEKVIGFEISCISDIPDIFNFGISFNNKVYYITSELPLGNTADIWKFLESIIKSGTGLLKTELEGPEQYLYALKTGDKNIIRLIYINNSEYQPVFDENNNFIKMRQNFENFDYLIRFDITVNTPLFLLEFYKELFALFQKQNLPEYDSVGQIIITKSDIVRKYFKDLSDEQILSLRNPKSINISGLKVELKKISE